jgi:hypothetical protein
MGDAGEHDGRRPRAGGRDGVGHAGRRGWGREAVGPRYWRLCEPRAARIDGGKSLLLGHPATTARASPAPASTSCAGPRAAAPTAPLAHRSPRGGRVLPSEGNRTTRPFRPQSGAWSRAARWSLAGRVASGSSATRSGCGEAGTSRTWPRPSTARDGSAPARRVLEAVSQVPTPVWGRDELDTGEMWSSNAVIAWVIETQRHRRCVDSASSRRPCARLAGGDRRRAEEGDGLRRALRLALALGGERTR